MRPWQNRYILNHYMVSLIFGIQNSTLAVVGALTGVALVALALVLAGSSRRAAQSSEGREAYECGIPTRGESMAQFHIGYYLYAILF